MTFGCLGLPGIRPRTSAALAQSTGGRAKTSSKEAPRGVYHRETQLGPFSESEREIALQSNSLKRSERAFKEFCEEVLEDRCTDTTRQEDEARKGNKPSLHSGPSMMLAQEEENLALGGDSWAVLAAMYRKFCAINFDEDKDNKGREARTLSVRAREQEIESRTGQKATGVGTGEVSARDDKPTLEMPQTLNAHNGVRDVQSLENGSSHH